MYITYDLQPAASADQPSPDPALRGAKEFTLAGPLLRWEVGEFDNASGVQVYGVRLEFRDPASGAPAVTVMEVPANARNVRVHRDAIPAPYRSALKTAV